MKVLTAALAVVALAAPTVARGSGAELVTALEHRSISLGDSFRYTVEARVETTAAVSVTADLGPFTAVAAPRTSRTRVHGSEVVRLEQIVVCLDRGCAPSAKARRVRLPRAAAHWEGGAAFAEPAEITLVPRVPASAVAAPRAHYRMDTRLPARPALGIVAAVLGVAASGLAACALLLAVHAFRRRPRARPVVTQRALSFDEAARFLRESLRRPGSDRRRAADFAARASAQRGDRTTATEAACVAWAPPEPDPADVSALAERIEQRAVGE